MHLEQKLRNWAHQHNVSPMAVADLYHILANISGGQSDECAGMSESAVQQRVRLEAATLNQTLWRNNVGVLKDARGIPVRYGLANDSKEMNKRVKSSDLIGITSIAITPQMVGRTVAVFTAPEVKAGNWHYTGTDHEKAQHRFHTIVNAAGGIAGFVKSPEDLRNLVTEYLK